jgi:hypothetical protein
MESVPFEGAGSDWFPSGEDSDVQARKGLKGLKGMGVEETTNHTFLFT